MKILVIGGGLGGLCLANGLRKEGIEVLVYERQLSDSEREGYFIHLEGQGLHALQRCLSPQGWDDFLATSTPTGAQWAFRDPQLQLIAMRDDVKITGKPLAVVERRAIERWELRSVLLKALGPQQSGIVRWNKTLTHYEELGDGQVRAHFEDGTWEDGDVLVAADGSKSRVREQRLPHIRREDLGIGVVCGRYPLDARSEGSIPELMKDSSLNNIVPYGKGWCFISSWRQRGHYTDSTPADQAYTLWAYFVPQGELPKNFKNISAAELRDIALAGVRGWASPIEKVVREADLSTVAPIYLRCAPHLDHWDPSNITLIGDAIHNMTPAAGVGANTALRDAENLTYFLAEAAQNGTSVVDAIGKYEAEMREYANAAVALSRQIAEGATSTSYLQRFAFRMVLNLAQNIPFVMKATVGRGAVESYMTSR